MNSSKHEVQEWLSGLKWDGVGRLSAYVGCHPHRSDYSGIALLGIRLCVAGYRYCVWRYLGPGARYS